jgi:hypothetical protein
MKQFFLRHWNHGKYVFWHKWYVFVECCKLGIPFRGIVHDWHRFLPVEWMAYSNKFKTGPSAGRDKSGHYDAFNTGVEGFALAWHCHQKRAWHHWQSWCSPRDGGKLYVFEMPDTARLEMLADMRGAARAQGTNDPSGYYKANKDHMVLGQETRAWLEWMLGLTTRTEYLRAATGDPNIKAVETITIVTKVEREEQ